MDLKIEAHGLELTESVRFHVNERLARITSTHAKRFTEVRVTLRQLGAGRNRETTCAIELDAVRGVSVRIEDRARSVWNAVDRCARLAEGIATELVRRVESNERPLGLGRLWG